MKKFGLGKKHAQRGKIVNLWNLDTRKPASNMPEAYKAKCSFAMLCTLYGQNKSSRRAGANGARNGVSFEY